MTDLVTSDDLKGVYQHALKATGRKVMLDELTKPPFSFTKEKSRQVVMKLGQNKLAYIPKENQADISAFVVREQELAMKLKSMTSPEMYLIFQNVELSGRQGISSRDILRNINDKFKKAGRPPMQAPAANRCLKALETEKYIKTIKCVHERGRKVFILYNLDPDTAVVGGAFYKDGEFNVSLVEAYRQKFMTYIASHHTVPQSKILQFIHGSELGQQLSEHDIEFIFRSLVLDQMLIQSVNQQTGESSYSEARWPSLEDIERLPCTSCELQHVCQIEEVNRFDAIALRRDPKHAPRGNKLAYIGNQPVTENMELSSKVTPATCPYYNQWLGIQSQPWPIPPNLTNDKDPI